MTINYYKINPGGNITAVVLNYCQRELRIKISQAILTSDPTIEQVGFWLPATDNKNFGRIEMMGGEFCGNAIRCLAYLIWQNNQNIKNFMVESSGVSKPISTKVFQNYSEINLSMEEFRNSIIGKYNLVEMPGIKHIITVEKFSKKEAFALLKKLDLLNELAVGVINITKNNKQIKIKPFVWVNAVKTFYEETACASGSLAVGYLYNNLYKNRKFLILQPSGTKLCVDLNKNNYISIGGPILSVENKQFIL